MSEHKDIDKFFQQRSAQHDFEYNPDAWAEMEILLDKDERSRRFWWWLSGFFVVGFSLFIFFYGANDTVDVNPITPKVSHAQASNNKQTQTNDAQKDVIVVSRDEKSDSATKEIEKDKINNGDGSSHPSEKAKSTLLAQKEIITNSNIDHFDESHSVEFVGVSLAAKKDASRLEVATETPLELANKLTLLPSLVPLPLVVETDDVDFSLTQKVKVFPTKASSQWLVGAFFASELSSVELENISRNNFRFGGQTSFRFKRKFGVGVGASYTRKKYKVNEGDYTPPKGFWTRKIAPQSTEATTDILELPVVVEFFPKGYEQNGLYTNLGLTSYFMLKEQYRYAYDLFDPDLIREWHTEKENNHWFGVGQVSVGYQRVMSPKVYAQFGSYVQMPLTGIGHGNVSLWSFGLDWKMNFLLR